MATRGTVLVVDDDPTITALLREALADEGYRVVTAPTVAGALDILAAIRIELVITDAFRPAPTPGDPWGALDTLAHAAGGIPLLLCTARPAAEYAGYADHGFAALLPKPFDLDALAVTVGALITAGATRSAPAASPTVGSPRHRER